MKTENRFPPGWDEERVRDVLEYYESQTEEEAVVELEAAYEYNPHYTMMEIPRELVPAVRDLISKHEAERESPVGVEDDVAAVGGSRDVSRKHDSQRREP